MHTKTNIFQLNNRPRADLNPGFFIKSGIAPNRVPLGHIYLQNPGSPNPTLLTKTVGTKITK